MIELPGELRWLEWVAGASWPAGNEDLMWEIADDWRQAADDLLDLVPDLESAIRETLAAYPDGDGGEEMRRQFTTLLVGDESLAALAGIFEEIGAAAHGVGTEIEYAKIMMYASLAALAIEIALAWVFPPTAPMVEAAAVTATQIGIRMLARRLVTAIAGYATREGLKRVGRFTMRHVVLTTGIGVTLDAGVQGYQLAAGHRDGMDWTRIGITAATSTVAGLVSAPGTLRLGNMLGRTALPEFACGITTGAVSGVTGAAGAWATGGLLTGNWSLDPRMLVGAGVQGAGVGAVKGIRSSRKLAVPRAGDGSMPVPDVRTMHGPPGGMGGSTTTRPGSRAAEGVAPSGIPSRGEGAVGGGRGEPRGQEAGRSRSGREPGPTGEGRAGGESRGGAESRMNSAPPRSEARSAAEPRAGSAEGHRRTAEIPSAATDRIVDPAGRHNVGLEGPRARGGTEEVTPAAERHHGVGDGSAEYRPVTAEFEPTPARPRAGDSTAQSGEPGTIPRASGTPEAVATHPDSAGSRSNDAAHVDPAQVREAAQRSESLSPDRILDDLAAQDRRTERAMRDAEFELARLHRRIDGDLDVLQRRVNDRFDDLQRQIDAQSGEMPWAPTGHPLDGLPDAPRTSDAAARPAPPSRSDAISTTRREGFAVEGDSASLRRMLDDLEVHDRRTERAMRDAEIELDHLHRRIDGDLDALQRRVNDGFDDLGRDIGRAGPAAPIHGGPGAVDSRPGADPSSHGVTESMPTDAPATGTGRSLEVLDGRELTSDIPMAPKYFDSPPLPTAEAPDFTDIDWMRGDRARKTPGEDTEEYGDGQ